MSQQIRTPEEKGPSDWVQDGQLGKDGATVDLGLVQDISFSWASLESPFLYIRLSFLRWPQ